MLWSSYCMLHGMYTLPSPCSSCPSVRCLPRWLPYHLLQHMSRDKMLQILPTKLNILQKLCRLKLVLFRWRHNVWSNRTALGVLQQLWIWPSPQPGHCSQSYSPLPHWAKLWHAGELTWQRCSGYWTEHHFGGNNPSTNWSNGECWKVCCTWPFTWVNTSVGWRGCWVTWCPGQWMYCLQVSGSGDAGGGRACTQHFVCVWQELSLTAKCLARKCDEMCDSFTTISTYICP